MEKTKTNYTLSECPKLVCPTTRMYLLLYCPLKTIKIGVRIYLTYNLHPSQHARESDVDFALIDGSVEFTTLRGREAPLYMILPC